jgi:indole-3-glycerol phosphate synthase
MILDEIVQHKIVEINHFKARVPLHEIESRLESAPAPRDFRAAIRRGDTISLIAEIKRRSPSGGELFPGADAPLLGMLYEQCGARAVSVLTDEKYFGGSFQDLTAVRQQINIPVLCKEFIIDPYQVFMARAAGADAILLIVRILLDHQLRHLHELAEKVGLAVLVETHTAEEIQRAIDCGAHIIGINNRDLDTLEVDVETTLRLKNLVPGGYVLVSESGIYTRAQVKRLEEGGVDAILVGESLLRSGNIREKIQELLGLETR